VDSNDTHALKLLGVASCVGVGFFIAHVLLNRSIEFWYMPWNLFLAWVPMLFSSLLIVKKHWAKPAKLFLLIAWLVFLPNSFYVVTDIIHINDQMRVNQTFDVLVLMTTIAPAFLVGLYSLWHIDRMLLSKLPQRKLALLCISLLCGIAIYIGRELRWNSWDIVANPLLLLRDLFATMSSPASLLQLLLVAVSFSVSIMAAYYLWTKLLLATSRDTYH